MQAMTQHIDCLRHLLTVHPKLCFKRPYKYPIQLVVNVNLVQIYSECGYVGIQYSTESLEHKRCVDLQRLVWTENRSCFLFKIVDATLVRETL